MNNETRTPEQDGAWLRERTRLVEDGKVPMVAAFIDRYGTTGAVRAVNRECDTSYRTKHLSEWKQGSRAIPRCVEKVMQTHILVHRFGPHGAKDLCRLLNI